MSALDAVFVTVSLTITKIRNQTLHISRDCFKHLFFKIFGASYIAISNIELKYLPK